MRSNETLKLIDELPEWTFEQDLAFQWNFKEDLQDDSKICHIFIDSLWKPSIQPTLTRPPMETIIFDNSLLKIFFY